MATPDENTQGTVMQDQGQAPQPQAQPQSQPQPASGKTEAGKGVSAEQAKTNIAAMIDQQEAMLERLNGFMTAMQDPRIGMQAESVELQQKLAALDAENNKRADDLNKKAESLQKKKGMMALVASVVAGAAGAVGTFFLARNVNKSYLKWGAIGGGGLGGSLIGGAIAAKMLSGKKVDDELANDMMAAVAATNATLTELTAATTDQIKQKVAQLSANPGAGQPMPREPQPPTAANPDMAAQAPAFNPSASVPPLPHPQALMHEPRAEQALPQVAAGVGAR